MSTSPSAKRARANSAGEAHVATGPAEQATEMDALQLFKYSKKIELVDKDAKDSILAAACYKHPDIKAMVDQWLEAKIRRESQRVIDFDWYSKSVWRDLNVTYRKLSGSKQFDKAFEVYEDIRGTINHIAKQCTGIASPQTRFNGLSVLRKIGKSIALSGDTLGYEVRKGFQSDNTPENAMCSIVEKMSPEQRKNIRTGQSGTDDLYNKLLELKNLGDDYCIFSDLNKVIELLDQGNNSKGESEGDADGHENGTELSTDGKPVSNE
ncbi:hypothetical protein VTN31DRAFT_2879 [Thermomyces dupontii]|uniref:uncharacterized protein n=1 Tax=Talaromyces thermophilus TaxID=28565 RepID=UPI0037431847